MLKKHPRSDVDGPPATPVLASLLDAAAAMNGGDVETLASLETLVDQEFEDDAAFARYMRKLHGSKRSMPCTTGIRYEHVVRFFQADKGTIGCAAHTFRNFSANIAKGCVPASIKPYIYGARLVAPAKPTAPGEAPGSAGHRPLGGGCVFRKIAFGYLHTRQKPQIQRKFQPLQMATAVRDGATHFANTIRTTLAEHPGWVAVKIDFSNAFNVVCACGCLPRQIKISLTTRRQPWRIRRTL